MTPAVESDIPRGCDATEARRITDQIRAGMEAVWQLISRAYSERAWLALGYTSWDAYCAHEFRTARLCLPREERSEVVSSLRDSGLSLRAIASATGNSVNTVRKDLEQVYQFDTPALAGSAAVPLVTGMDGKNYPSSPPLRARRSSLTDTARGIGVDLRKITNRIEKLIADDRLDRNKDTIGTLLRYQLEITIRNCIELQEKI